MKNLSQKHILVGILLVAVILLMRSIPHMPNFTPVAAIALFAAFYIPNRFVAWLIPMVGMLLSDILFLDHYAWQMMLFNYVAISIPVIWGPMLRRYQNSKPAKQGIALFGWVSLGSLAFFLLSNLGVWMFGQIYALTLGGLVYCYVAALPFLLTTWLGDLCYGTVLFGAYEFAAKRATQSQLEASEAA